MSDDFGKRFNDWVKNESPKGKCELCGETFPEVTLMHLNRSEQSPICCGGCAMKEIDRRAKAFMTKSGE